MTPVISLPSPRPLDFRDGRAPTTPAAGGRNAGGRLETANSERAEMLKPHGIRTSGSLLVAWGATAALVLGCGCGGPRSADEQVRSGVRQHIEAANEEVSVEDPRTGELMKLRFDHVHGGVGATEGGRHVVCVDFQDADGTVYDVDYYVGGTDEAREVQDLVMHKVDGASVLSAEERSRLERVAR
jgi:hypothetical protein